MCELKENIKNNEKDVNNLNSIDKTLCVIDCIFYEKEILFIDIYKKLDIPKATLHRILQSLENGEYIERNEITDKYSLGIKFIYYSETMKSNMTIIKITQGILKDLAKTIGETVNIGILYHDNVLNILSVKGKESVLTSRLIPISPLNCSGIGKLFLAYKNDLELASYFANEQYERRTKYSIYTLEDFKKERKKILDLEISIDNEEYEHGLFCIAAPLKNHNGVIKAAVSITGPKVRIESKNIDLLQNELKKSTAMINAILIKIKFELDY